MTNTFPGPVPAESNPPITPQYYQPSRFVITDVALGQTTTITMTPATVGGTTVNPNYVIGQLVRTIIPPTFGCRQLNNRQAYVLSLPSADEVELELDSSFFDPFISSPSFDRTPPQIMAIGDINQGAINSGRTNNTTYVYGSFINISPN